MNLHLRNDVSSVGLAPIIFVTDGVPYTHSIIWRSLTLMEPMQVVYSSANDEDNEPPEQPPDEPLPKKLSVITFKLFFTFGRKVRGSNEPMKIPNCDAG